MVRPKLKESDLKQIANSVEREFPNDPALQQVHLARRILQLEAQRAGMTFLQYSSKLAKDLHRSKS